MQEPYRLLWGFPNSGSHSPLLKSLFTSPAGHFVYNNVKIQFTISKNAPSSTSGFYYRVTARLQNSGVLDGSIAHNMPSMPGRAVACKSFTVPADNTYSIVCDYVGGLQTTKKYFVAAKVWYLSTHTFGSVHNLDFGKITIEAVTVTDAAANTLQLSSTLFTGSGGETLSSGSFLLAANLRGEDQYSGFLYNFYHTQVLSVPESGISGSTPDHMTHLWGLVEDQDQNSPYRGWGIVQQPASVQQTLFLLLKISPSQFYTSAPTAQTQAKLEIYFNNEILGFPESANEMNKGLQLGYSSSAAVVTGAVCTAGTQCANYDQGGASVTGKSQLNGIDYNYKELFTNKIDDAPLYGRYTFLCGNNKKDSVSPVGTSDVSKCVFDGTYNKASDGKTHLLAMRKVQFKADNLFAGYAASDQYSLDFVVGLYSGEMSCIGDPCTNPDTYQLVTQTVIHGYMIKRLASNPSLTLRATLVNCWAGNDGASMPTMLRVHGRLASELIPSSVNAVGVFFDNQVDLAFVEEFASSSSQKQMRRSNAYHCAAVQGAVHKSSCEVLYGVEQELTSIWTLNTGVVVKDFTLTAGTDFSLYIPLKTVGATNPRFLTLAFLQSSSQSSYQLASAF